MILSPFAYATGDPQATVMVFQTSSGGAIYAVNPDGSNLRYLTTGMDPALSPDGHWVAFTRWDGVQNGVTGSLWVINVDGSGEALLGSEFAAVGRIVSTNASSYRAYLIRFNNSK